MLLSTLYMDLCLQEDVFDTPMVHDNRSKQQISQILPVCLSMNCSGCNSPYR